MTSAIKFFQARTQSKWSSLKHNKISKRHFQVDSRSKHYVRLLIIQHSVEIDFIKRIIINGVFKYSPRFLDEKSRLGLFFSSSQLRIAQIFVIEISI